MKAGDFLGSMIKFFGPKGRNRLLRADRWEHQAEEAEKGNREDD